MTSNWYFGKDRSDSIEYRKYDFLCKLQPDDFFIQKYSTNKKFEYMLMKRTKCRKWDEFLGKYVFTDDKIHLHTIYSFCENYFGYTSNKVFSTLDDPELNMLTNIYFGKNANELPLLG